MTGNWKDILKNSGSVDQKKLMDYLEGRLSEADKHDVESLLNDSAFVDDAMEGLGQMKDKQKIASIITELDNQLKQKVNARKKKRRLSSIYFPAWLIIATFAIILLIVLAYTIYKMYTSGK